MLGLVLGLWAYVVRPEGRWTRWGASLSLFAMVPGAYIVEWSSRHPGFGAVEIAATVVLAMGLLVLFLAVVGLPVRGLLAVVDRRRRRHDRPTLGEWAVAWLRSKQRLQILAVLLVAMSSLWLLVATFLPVPGVQRGGAMGAFVHVLRRLGLVANDLAIGVAAAGVVMWFQEDRFWSRDSRPSPLPRRAGRRTAARTRRLAKRWASRS